MKYIFDFDNVLFFTAKHRNYVHTFLEKAGIPRKQLDEYYIRARPLGFSLKKLLIHFSLKQKLYEEIMAGIEKFANIELIEKIRKIGKNNCYIVTFGNKEFQLEKIRRIGIEPLFTEIITVPEEYKKEVIERICENHKDERVVFVDDKQKHFDELDLEKCPNLETILYTGQSI